MSQTRYVLQFMASLTLYACGQQAEPVGLREGADPGVAESEERSGTPEPAQTQPIDEEAPGGLDPSEWRRLKVVIDEEQRRALAARRVVRALPYGFAEATNRTSGLSSTFTPQGAALESTTSPGWRATVRLERFGRASAMKAASDALAQVAGERVEYIRAPGLTEWYVNGQGGLEHGFTLAQRPERGDGVLRFEVGLDGARAQALPDGALALVSGTRNMRYQDLRVWDAEGEDLGASMRPSEGGFVVEVDDAGATYPVTVDPTFRQTDKLTASDAAANDQFGFDVDVSGDRVVVGAFGDDDAGSSSGSAYVFERDAQGTWSQAAKLTASDAVADDSFGYSVGISGDYIVIGAIGNDDAGDRTGSAYVFERTAQGVWDQADKLLARDRGAQDEFGLSVDVSGDYIVIGAIGNDDAGSSSGSAYVFERDAQGTWSQAAKLTASDADASDQFGGSVAISGGHAIVGSFLDDDAGSSSGSAYVFERDAQGVWSQAAKLTASDAAAGDSFGFGVGISGGHAIVGSFLDDDAGSSSGSAYVFERDAQGVWSQATKLTASDAAAGDSFGQRVDASGDRVAVGSYFDDDAGSNSGSAYVFERGAQGAWDQTDKLTASDAAASDFFGIDVALSGDRVVVGSFSSPAGMLDAGSAYVFDALKANDDAFRTDEDVTATLDVLANDTTFPGATVGGLTTPSAGGVVGVTASNQVEYTPAAEFNGAETFSYTLSLGAVTSTATATVTVDPVNDAPMATPGITATTDEDMAVAITLSATDIDDATSTLSFAATDGANGAVAVSGDVATYTPAPDFDGADSFTFTAIDPQGATSAPAIVTLTVAPVNDAPLANDGASVTDEDADVVLIPSGSDPEGDSLTVRVTRQPAHGTLSGNPANPTYTPDPDFNGEDELGFVLNDGALDSAEAAISITVVPVNDPPTAADVQAATGRDMATMITLLGVDVDGDALTYIVEDPPFGTISGAGPVVTYTPDDGFDGADTFNYNVSDDLLLSDRATVTVVVTGEPNVAPVFIDPTPTDDATFEAIEGDTLTFAVAAQDADAGPLGLTLEVTGAPDAATFDPRSGTFTWQTEAGDAGDYPLVVSATDGLARVERAVSLRVASPSAGDDMGSGADAGEPDGSTGSSPDLGCCATAPGRTPRTPLVLLATLLGLAALARRRYG